MSAKFKLPEMKMPTPEEHREVSLRWLERVRPTLIDQWPREVSALSFNTELVPIEAGPLVEELYAVHDGKERGPIMNALAVDLDARMGWDRKFIRLNSRSPKDYPWPFHVPATHSGKEAVDMLCGSMRILDDLYEFKWLPEQSAYVCLRDWQYGLRSEDEYRCFVKDGSLIAVTAYDYTKEIETPADGGKAIRQSIDQYFSSQLKPVLHLDTVVFDLWIRREDDLRLIELNPYGMSDPCHFKTYERVENAANYIEYSRT